MHDSRPPSEQDFETACTYAHRAHDNVREGGYDDATAQALVSLAHSNLVIAGALAELAKASTTADIRFRS